MRKVIYTDSIGRKFQTLIPDGAPEEHANYGVLVGPPELDIDLPERLAVTLHNELFAREIFTMRDVKRRRDDVLAAVRSTFKIDCEVIAQCFQEFESGRSDSDRL
jgi:hypothetical protein